MYKYNLFNFVLYKCYRISIIAKSEKPLNHSAGLMGSMFSLISLIICLKLVAIGLMDKGIPFSVFIFLSIFSSLIIYKYYKHSDRYLKVLDLYDNCISKISNKLTDIIAALSILIIISVSVLFYNF